LSKAVSHLSDTQGLGLEQDRWVEGSIQPGVSSPFPQQNDHVQEYLKEFQRDAFGGPLVERQPAFLPESRERDFAAEYFAMQRFHGMDEPFPSGFVPHQSYRPPLPPPTHFDDPQLLKQLEQTHINSQQSFESIWNADLRQSENEAAWIEEFRCLPPQRNERFSEFERIYDAESWAEDFNRSEFSIADQSSVNSGAATSNVVQGGKSWAEDFQDLEEVIEEERWFSQFLPGGGRVGRQTTQDWISEFESKHGPVPSSSTSWIDEFNAQRNQTWEQEFQRMQSTPSFNEWAKEFQPTNMPSLQPSPQPSSSWVNEYNRDSVDISELTDQISSIKDPKLQNSMFMQFINQVRNGDISLDG